ncbi:glutathione S-transferase U9-like [Amaranthus tricolor]|uniref:glutathione S-transferase U9-like n=1 Tax=Amaranthus tricolor TaxID=29722 RepID=UPI00258E118E|nr:glutathione S-transferase U9-like [Amaranthus tricolor]
MAEESSVKLHGMWASPFVLRVKLGLQIKGIKYDYIEEDLDNKSELLLQYNPVYKKVPVLVHNGRPISESSVILEYIDEAWPAAPYLLPKDPYEKAKHRFWAAYFQQISEGLAKTMMTEGKLTEETLKEFWNKLDIAEELLKKEMFSNGCPSFKDEMPGFLDITLYAYYGTSDMSKDLFGVEVLPSDRFPLITSWIKALSEVPLVKQAGPPKDKMLQHLKFLFQHYLPPKA